MPHRSRLCVMIRLRDGLGRFQSLSTTVPRLAEEIPHIAVIHLRDEVTLEHFQLKGRGDAVAALRGWCRMRVEQPPQGVRTPSKRYAPQVLSPHLGHMQCNTIVAAPRKSNNEKPTFNFAMRIDVDQSYNPAKTIVLNSAYVQRLDFCTEFLSVCAILAADVCHRILVRWRSS